MLIGRLKKRASFLRLRKGNAWRTGALALQARHRDGGQGVQMDAVRFGFTATKRLGPAVIRNRARRRLKEAVRLNASGHVKPGYDYVVIARRGALTQSFTQLQRDLCRALDHIHKD